MKLQWSKQPSRSMHRILGWRHRWTARGGDFRVERFPQDGYPLFIALALGTLGWRVICRRRTLKAAQRSCQTIAKATKNCQLKAGN